MIPSHTVSLALKTTPPTVWTAPVLHASPAPRLFWDLDSQVWITVKPRETCVCLIRSVPSQPGKLPRPSSPRPVGHVQTWCELSKLSLSWPLSVLSCSPPGPFPGWGGSAAACLCRCSCFWRFHPLHHSGPENGRCTGWQVRAQEGFCCEEAKNLWILHMNVTVSQEDERPWGRVTGWCRDCEGLRHSPHRSHCLKLRI